MIWQDSLRLSDSHLTCIVEINSPCLSSHEDVYIFQCQQATIFTATLLFQPQLITTMYIQLQMIKHIHHQFVVLRTCTRTLCHTRHIREMQEIFRCTHNNKHFIERFLIRSMSCKLDHVWRWFLSSTLVLSRLINHSYRFFFFVWQRKQLCVNISNWSLYYIDSGTQHHNKMIF